MQRWRQGHVRRVERITSSREADALVLDHLAKLGCDPSVPRECRHYVYVPAELGARAIASSLSSQGWDATYEEVSDAWLVTAATVTRLNDEIVRETRLRLEALAGDHGGEYDGWEAAAD